MTFLLSVALLCGCGVALVDLLGLRPPGRVGAVALGWFVGAAYFGLICAALRFLGGVPHRAPAALAVLAVPMIAWIATRRRRTPSSNGAAERWWPRPTWLFALLAAYVLVTTVAVALHGFNTPTNTDDGLRVRAFVPILAYADAWSDAARALFVMTGPVSTFVPALSSVLSGTLDPFAGNYVAIVDLVALLALVIGVSSARGEPERGWASAFAVLSLPLFVYHCTTTYADAAVAIHIGAAVFFLIELGAGKERADAGRALLLLGAAALVKREAELVAAPIALLILVASSLRQRRLREVGWLAPYPLFAAVKVAAVGFVAAFPFVSLFVARAQLGPDGFGPVPVVASAAPAAAAQVHASRIFLYALFDSGNAGVLFFVLAPAAVLGMATMRRRGLDLALLAVTLLFVEAAVTALWLFPQFTLNQSTVHRSLFPTSVAGALWLAAYLSAEARAPQR